MKGEPSRWQRSTPSSGWLCNHCYPFGVPHSGESDFGVHHIDPGYRGVKFRVSVVADTGDVYALNQWSGEVWLLGTIVPTADDVDTKPRYPDNPYPAVYVAADRLFEGWTDGLYLGRQVRWFADRLK